jgi:hypothetical protein
MICNSKERDISNIIGSMISIDVTPDSLKHILFMDCKYIEDWSNYSKFNNLSSVYMNDGCKEPSKELLDSLRWLSGGDECVISQFQTVPELQELQIINPCMFDWHLVDVSSFLPETKNQIEVLQTLEKTAQTHYILNDDDVQILNRVPEFKQIVEDYIGSEFKVGVSIDTDCSYLPNGYLRYIIAQKRSSKLSTVWLANAKKLEAKHIFYGSCMLKTLILDNCTEITSPDPINDCISLKTFILPKIRTSSKSGFFKNSGKAEKLWKILIE